MSYRVSLVPHLQIRHRDEPFSSIFQLVFLHFFLRFCCLFGAEDGELIVYHEMKLFSLLL